MPTTYTTRTVPTTTYTTRQTPTKYVQLLQDAFNSVIDLDGSDIYVYYETGIPVEGTIREQRILPS